MMRVNVPLQVPRLVVSFRDLTSAAARGAAGSNVVPIHIELRLEEARQGRPRNRPYRLPPFAAQAVKRSDACRYSTANAHSLHET
jgi:hypothetical protein